MAKRTTVWKRDWLPGGSGLEVSPDGTRLAAPSPSGVDLPDADLRRFARANVPQLRAALRDAAPEAGRRLAAILESARVPSGEELRAVQAVEVAEAVGGAGAAAVLAGWAVGGGPLAREARPAAARMRGR